MAVSPAYNKTEFIDNSLNGVNDEVFVFPASFAQQRLWFLDQFEPNSPFYNIPVAIRFNGELNVTALEQSINEIVNRHETLRTTFASQGGEPVQVISPYSAVTIPVQDLSYLPEKDREEKMIRLANQEARTPFNLERGPLMRVTLLKLIENDYVMLLTMHHIISDGWSMSVFVREVAILYEAFINGQPSPLPELPIQYADFALWQQEWLKGEILELQLAYWKKQLGGNLPMLELPTDRPRPTVQTSRGANAAIIIPKEIADTINDLSRKNGVTLFMTLVAAFQTLLYRYTGQEDICVGSPIANRTRAETEGLIGFFVNTLVLRTGLSGNPSFLELLQRVREVTLGSYSNQDIPFEHLVDAIQPTRDLSHSPLFQVMFILQNTPQKIEVKLPELRLSQVDADAGTSTFDMTLMVTEQLAGFNTNVEYNTDLFDASTIYRFLGHFRSLLQDLAANPEKSISQLQILTDIEQRQIIFEWNDTGPEFPRSQGIHHLFQAQVERTPDAIALAVAGDYLSYRELNRRANKLAHFLKKIGAEPDVLVGICVERSMEMIVAVMAVLKAGSAYLPIDPVYPTERIAHMLEDADVLILLTQKRLVPSLPDHIAEVIRLDADWQYIEPESEENLTEPVTSANLAYAIYTSGSTGKSKGTLVQHGSIVNAYLAWEKAYDLRMDGSNHLQMASFSFDVFTGDLTRALCSGGRLVICPRELLLAPELLYDLMIKEKINCAEFVPVVVRNLIQYLEKTNQKLDFMRILIAASDVWYVGEYKKFLKFCGPNTRLMNSFGLTEATIDTTYFEGAQLNLTEDRLVPIGRPFANNQVYILDAVMVTVPVGVPGELYVGGRGVAVGYLNRPDLTAEKFVPDPFSEVPGDRIYKTGDLARYLPDGNIEFLGRIDTQVKIRGFRIELGEIETALSKHPRVQNVVVIAREDTPGDKRLVAYLVANQETTTIGELRSYLKEQVPDYMVPSAFVFLETLPLLPNGKVDRRSLPVPSTAREDRDDSYVAPCTPTEEKMAGIWSKLLNVDKIGSYDNFFELGGHSLLATQLVSRIRDTFKVDVPLRKLFEFSMLSELARTIDVALLAENVIETPAIEPIPGDRVNLPLSFAQQRLWFIDQLQPGIPFYNIPEVDRIQGPVNVSALEQAINEIIRRHEILRTTFKNVDGKPVQIITNELVLEFPLVDLQGLSESERENVALQMATDNVRQPFNLEQGPLLRALLLRLAPDNHIVVLTMHHIISDGWSSGVLLQEVGILYNAFCENRPAPLPELPIQYADFAYWQRKWLQGQVLENQLNYWRKQLSGSPPVLELSTDRPRPIEQNFKGGMRSFIISGEMTRALNDLGRQSGTTMFMTMLAAFKALLYRYSGQEDISVGTPIANRTHPDLEKLVGFFVNTLVLRTNLSGAPGFRELLTRVRQVALEAYAHQDVPFEMLVAELQPERDLSHTPLFQVMFVLQEGTGARQKMGKLILTPVEIDRGATQFDLTLWIIQRDDGMEGLMEYNPELFNESTIERLLGHFQILLQAITQDPGRSIALVPMLTEVENQVLNNWNDTTADLLHGQFVQQLFETQVDRTPFAIAADYGNVHLNYRSLNERANKLAHYLQKLDVGPEVLVGVYLERSLDLLVGLLGILKAGAAYVPLDPSYPEERLRFMVADSGIKLLLTQERFSADLPINGNNVICLDSMWGLIDKMSDKNPEPDLTPDNLAYVIYTSGSTGKPKGTLITHRGLTNYLNWCLYAYPVHEGRGSLVHSTIAFDATVTGLFVPLLVGRTVGLIPEIKDLELLGTRLRTEKDFSLVKITPAHLEILSHQISPEEAPGLTRAFIIGGENLTAEHVAFWYQHSPTTELVNEYGPTETVVGCCVYWVPAAGIKSGSVPIGRAIINTTLYVLDRYINPVAIGIPGELYIGGAGVARGYLNRSDLTAERFVPDPFCKLAGARLYRTGDLVRYLPDGNLEFLGRIDHQVKIRGYRIELGEIEDLLGKHPALREVVVVTRDDNTGAKRLVAYFVPTQEPAPNASELRNYLKEQLPEYMVPSAFVVLDKLPLTPNGKVDRRALPAPEQTRDELATVFVAPRTATEELLANIWRELIGLDRVGVYDSFFELGGHSLLATQLFSRVRDTFKVELPLRSIFDAPTIAALAEKIETVSQIDGKVSAPPLRPFPRGDGTELPLSFSQQRLWFLDQLEPGETIYNIPTALRLSGNLNLPALEQSFNEIIRRHESLRTTFATVAGKPVQVLAESLEWAIKTIDLGAMTGADREAEANRLAAMEALMPFDLARGPLIRALLITLTDEDHVFLVTMHHIISDGWSVGVLIQEIVTLYQAFSTGQAASLPELYIQYADYARWQRHWLQGEILEAQINFWRQQLENSSPILELPTDRPRPAVKTFNGGQQVFRLPGELYHQLKELSQKENVTMFMTLMAAFQTLLYRYSGQDDINVGTPIANRNRLETEKLIGFFVNTLVIRTNFSGNPIFRDCLKQVRETALGAFAYQEVPFEKLVETLQPERNLSHTPLFQVMFALQNAPRGSFELPGLTIRPVNPQGGATQFDLTLSMIESENDLSGSFEYNTDLFNADTISRMQHHFLVLLEGIALNPNQTVLTLPLLDEKEKQQLLQEWNDTIVDYPAFAKQGVHQLFEARVEKTPNAIAVVFDELKLTYAGLNIRANQLAHYLQKLGVGPGNLVGISIDRTFQMVVGLLGIMKAGAAYLPLDPSYPKDRLAYMIEDSKVNVLLTQNEIVDRLPKNDATLICLDTDWDTIARENRDNPITEITHASLAYVIYTSGSTGAPKGVMLRHRGLVNLTQSQIPDFNVTAISRVLQFASFSFDASVSEIFMALLSGATLYLARREVLMSIPDLLRLFHDEKITTVTLPPSLLKVLPDENLTTLETIVSAGESCSRDIAARWAVNRRLLNAYGPTESTVGVSCFLVDRIPEGSTTVPIGRPIANTQLYLLDQNMNPVPRGIAGELYIGSIGLAVGYLNRPDLTAEKFVPNPFSKDDGARLYKTGDLARFLPDGNIEFLGRIDHQVKVRGFRMELGEIEAGLTEHPNIREAVVLAKSVNKTGDDKKLVAYIVTAPDTRPSIGELRTFLTAKLPEYMVPSIFVTLATMPLTPNQKVDRKALPEPDANTTDMREAYVAPHTETEELLAGIWSQSLGLEKIGIYDNFFDLGGHSLLATQVMSRIREAFQLELPIRNLFETPVLAGLARVIDTARMSKHGLTEVKLEPVSRQNLLPMSFAQERLWFLDRLEPGNVMNNITDAVRLRGALNVPALEQCLNEIVRRHEGLRTTFKLVNGKPIQNIARNMRLSLVKKDLRELAPEEREDRAIVWATEDIQQSFDLASGPLIRATLLWLDENDHVIILTMHHIISDGWSIGILINEIAALYQAYATGQPASLPELTIQYADFAWWQRQWLQGQVLETQLSFWKERLANIPPLLELPTDRPRPPMKTFNGAQQLFELAPALSLAIKKLTRDQDSTLFMTLMAAFQTLLYRYSGQENISVGTPIANRNRLETEALIGFFVNTLVINTYFGDDPSFKELLKQVRETALGGYAHQDIPFEKLVEVLQPKRDLSHTPLFQVMFVLQNAPIGTMTMPDLVLSPVAAQRTTTQFDLTLSMREGANNLVGTLEYNTDLFNKDTIVRLLHHFVTLLEGIVTNPNTPVSLLPLLTEEQKRLQLIDWNDTVLEFEDLQNNCVHQIFAEQVGKTPHAIAVVFEGQQLSYDELNRRANQLAWYLQKQGIDANMFVGICAERSIEMIIGILGTLKAGAAFVPLDPAYPKDRLDFMIRDSGIQVLLTQQHLPLELSGQNIQKICLDSQWEIIRQESEAFPVGRAAPDSLAYMIYTSGSTGRPKGVMLRHRGLVNLTKGQIADFEVDAASRVLQFASFSFDASVSEIFMALLTGATLYLARRETLMAPAELLRLFKEEKITTVTLPPSVLSVLPDTELPELRTIISAGESCSREIVERWGTGRRFLNAYGPTEATVGVTCYVASSVPESVTTVPIGKPIINTQLYILDRKMNPIPPGVAGELYIGSVGLAVGYYNRPDLTAEKFVPNPFQDEMGARLYRTGDLTRFLPDGNIEFLGRIDHQVKVRGFRIELGEIEAVLGRHPAIQEVAVVVREDEPVGRDKRIVAYVVFTSKIEITIEELRNHLKEKLPEYMVPSAFVTLEALPLTPNGKIDRKALPAPDMGQIERDRELVAPRDTLELQLVQLWEEVLKIRPIGVTDNFFELGGHSLMAIHLLGRIQNDFNKEIPLVSLFQEPTIEHLASMLRDTEQKEAGAALVKFQDNNGKTPIFFVHPSGGSVHWYADLARHLDHDQPFYGLQARGRDGKDKMHTRLEDMAAYYIHALQERQPEGPYIIGSWSMGIIIAYEMAQQLRSSGQKIGLLLILDQGPFMPKGMPEDDAAFLAGMFGNRLTFDVDELRKMDYDGQVKHVLKQAKKKKLLSRFIRVEQFGEYVQILKTQMVAWDYYKIKPYPGKVTLFKSVERYSELPEEHDLGWSKVARGGVEIFQVPGNHNTMLHPPNVSILAETITQCIQKMRGFESKAN